jgi:hypothetical protein
MRGFRAPRARRARLVTARLRSLVRTDELRRRRGPPVQPVLDWMTAQRGLAFHAQAGASWRLGRGSAFILLSGATRTWCFSDRTFRTARDGRRPETEVAHRHPRRKRRHETKHHRRRRGYGRGRRCGHLAQRRAAPGHQPCAPFGRRPSVSRHKTGAVARMADATVSRSLGRCARSSSPGGSELGVKDRCGRPYSSTVVRHSGHHARPRCDDPEGRS